MFNYSVLNTSYLPRNFCGILITSMGDDTIIKVYDDGALIDFIEVDLETDSIDELITNYDREDSDDFFIYEVFIDENVVEQVEENLTQFPFDDDDELDEFDFDDEDIIEHAILEADREEVAEDNFTRFCDNF